MRVNPTTKLFEDISPEERVELMKFATVIVQENRVPAPLPAWVDAWVNIAQPGVPCRLHELPAFGLRLVMSSLVQKVMYSLLMESAK
jgi:hypothetical protein